MQYQLTEKTLWGQLSKKAKDKILHPYNQGAFALNESEREGFRAITSESGNFASGAMIRWHWLVDLEDGVITDVRYQCFGPTALIAAMESTSEMIISKAYDRIAGLKAEEIEKALRDKPDTPALPPEATPFLNLILEALDLAAASASDIEIAHPMAPISSPDMPAIEGQAQYQETWLTLSDKQRLSIVRECIEKEIRPYVELDQGGVEAIGIEEHFLVQIVYSGACDGCFAATGSTLSSIQAILRAKIHSDIRVEPQL